MSSWTPNVFMEKLYDEALEGHGEAASSESPEARRTRLREALRKAIGEFPRMAAPVAPTLLERVDCGSYVRERVQLSILPGMSFAAYVLIPKSRAKGNPGVLAIHGHGYGSREIIGLLPDGTPNADEPTCHRDFALGLVGRGLLVVAPDVVGFGERRLDEHLATDPRNNSSCYDMATRLLLHGKTLTGLRTAELLGALDYLAAREEVDASRIGAMGFSGGALLAWICASFDERIRATVLSGFPGTFKGTIMHVHHCVDNYTPGLLAQAELPEWIGLIAPRPLFVESATRDPIFPAISARNAVAELSAHYGRLGAADRFASDVFEGVHEVNGRIAYGWLADTLAEIKEVGSVLDQG